MRRENEDQPTSPEPREQGWVDFSRRLEAEALRRGEFRGHLLEDLIGVGFGRCNRQQRGCKQPDGKYRYRVS